MREIDNDLYKYLLENGPDMTQEWLSRRQVETGSVYSADASPATVKRISEQNQEFIRNISKVFIDRTEEFEITVSEWAIKVSEDRASSDVPLYVVVHQFMIFRSVYLTFIEKFARETERKVVIDDVFRWVQTANFAFDAVIDLFSKHYFDFTNKLLSAKEKIIHELSSPVIPVTNKVGVVPLVGEIDIDRAAAILESVLKQSTEKRIEHLCIDLSGVPEMDAVVAGRIFQVIKALNLVGIRAILSGLRPEVASAAIQQGIDFKDTPVEANLAMALAKINWK